MNEIFSSPDAAWDAAWAGILLILGAMERAMLKRGHVHLTSIRRWEDSEDHCLFSVEYQSRGSFMNSRLGYTLRNPSDPHVVIHGDTRELRCSKHGKSYEPIRIDKKSLCSGAWVLDVQATTTGSRLNPLYKIFPTHSQIQKKVHIK